MLVDILAENIEYEIANDFSGFNGTSYQGNVTTNYSTLENLFGKPSISTGDPYEKVQTEWFIEGKVFYTDQWGERDWEYVKATVYNWKTEGTPIGEYDWHIGGKSYESVDFIQEIINRQVTPEYNWND